MECQPFKRRVLVLGAGCSLTTAGELMAGASLKSAHGKALAGNLPEGYKSNAPYRPTFVKSRGLAREIDRHWHIILLKTLANIKAEYDRAFLGVFWCFLEPFLNTFVLVWVLSEVLQVRRAHMALSIAIGTVVYGHLSLAINAASSSLLQQSGFLRCVRLPKLVPVLVAIATTSWKFWFAFLALIPFALWEGCPVGSYYFAFAPLVLLQIAFAIAFSAPLAALVPYFPDLRTVVATVLAAGMWVSGVLFEPESVPHALRSLYFLNPIAALIEGYRDILMRGHWPSLLRLTSPLTIVVPLFIVGVFLLKKVDREVGKLGHP
jgi:lipopolysaccharide transport system permease protein